MPEVFKNEKAILGISSTLIYTVPVSAVAIVIGCQITQSSGDLRTLDLWWTDASDVNNISYLGKSIKIPPEVSYNPIGGKLVLNEGDSLYGLCDTAAMMHVTLSVLEIS